MSRNSAIAWCDGTWNPFFGCSKVSDGCTNCYALGLAWRHENNPRSPYYHTGIAEKRNGKVLWTGKVVAAEDALTRPMRWRKPQRIFVNSMSDLFHEDIPDELIDEVFAVMALCPQHTFIVLTKRAERMQEYCINYQTPFRVARQIDAISSMQGIGLETVRPIDRYPGYFASSHGFIYSEKGSTRRRMKPDIGKQGHQRVQLHRDGAAARDRRLLVHRIILETFVGPAPSADAQACHRDGNPANNRVSNLRWGKQKDNWSDSKRHGTYRRYSKLTNEKVVNIRHRHAVGESYDSLGREYDVSGTQIRNIIAGRQWAVPNPIEWPLKQCWLGISVEDQKNWEARRDYLYETPAVVKFLSCEPLLGNIWLADNIEWLNWVIVGCESGHRARYFSDAWARDLRDQCQRGGVPFFFKQHIVNGKKIETPELDGQRWAQYPHIERL